MLISNFHSICCFHICEHRHNYHFTFINKKIKDYQGLLGPFRAICEWKDGLMEIISVC